VGCLICLNGIEKA